MFLHSKRRCQERNISMIAQKNEEIHSKEANFEENDEPVDVGLWEMVKSMRRNGDTKDTDRIVFFEPDEPIRLYSAFGHDADDVMFKGIVAANFAALNPGLAG